MMLTCTGLFILRHHLMNMLNLINAVKNKLPENDYMHRSVDRDSSEKLISKDRPPRYFLEHSNICDYVETETLSHMTKTIKEQIPITIRDFSSQYGSNSGDSYVVSNVCSNPEIYPLYGDSTHALVFRTYGPWWIQMPSYQETIKNFTRWENYFTSRDFIDIEFQDFVYECISLNIYETYNPGTLEVVYVGKEDEHGNNTWHRVWTFPESFSIILSNNEEFSIVNGKNNIKN